MPKKTKKDKIMARIRRSSSPLSSSSRTVESIVGSTSPYTFLSSSDKKLQQTISEYTTELKTIKSDLYKTILLAIIAFSVEISIYWLLQH